MIYRIVVFLFATLLGHAMHAQYLHLSKNAFNQDDPVNGVLYLMDSKQVGYSYTFTLFDENKSVLTSSFFFAEKSSVPFELLPLEETNSGMYILQVSNYQSNAVIATRSIMILGAGVEAITSNGVYNQEPPSKELEVNYNLSGPKAQLQVIDLKRETPIKNVSVSIRDLKQDVQLTSKQALCSSNVPAEPKFKLKGAGLAGRILDTLDNPIRNADVLLGVHGSNYELLNAKTDANGFFILYDLLYFDDSPAYISVLKKGVSQEFRMQIQEKRITFNQPCNLPAPQEFNLGEVARLRELQKRVQSNYVEIEKKEAWVPAEPVPIFNHNELLDLDEYVPFKSVKQLMKEAVSSVLIRKNEVKVFSSNTKRMLRKDPVLFIDGVIVSSDQFMSFETEDIKYLEVVDNTNTLVRYGNYALGGIVSIITRNGFNKDLYAQRIELPVFSKLSSTVTLPKRVESVPFFPQVLYWNANALSDDEQLEIEFDLPIYQTDLSIEFTYQDSNNEVFVHKDIITLADD